MNTPLDGAIFIRKTHCWAEHQSWKCRLHPWKTCQKGYSTIYFCFSFWYRCTQPVVILYIHSLGPNSVLQDDNTCPQRVGFIREYLQNLGVERMVWPACSSDLNSDKHLWSKRMLFWSKVTNATILIDLKQMLHGWRIGCHPATVCNQAGEQLVE